MSLPSFNLIGQQTTELLQGFVFQGLRSLFSESAGYVSSFENDALKIPVREKINPKTQ